MIFSGFQLSGFFIFFLLRKYETSHSLFITEPNAIVLNWAIINDFSQMFMISVILKESVILLMRVKAIFFCAIALVMIPNLCLSRGNACKSRQSFTSFTTHSLIAVI